MPKESQRRNDGNVPDEAVLDTIRYEPHIIGNWAGFTDLSKLHDGWISALLFADSDFTLMAHRGSYKTTCLSVGLALFTLIYPSDGVLLVRKTDDDVKEIIHQISKLLRGEVFQQLAIRLYGHGFALSEDTAFSITTSLNTSPKGASQILGLGIKTSMQGKHAKLVVTDDIVNIKDRISKRERDLTVMAYREVASNIKNRDGRIFNTCTPWHKDDATNVMANVHRHDCYETGLIERTKLNELRCDLGSSMFAINYELKHIADEEAMFTDPAFTDDAERLYQGTCHIDAAYGGSDYTAFTALKEVDGQKVVLGKLWAKHVDDCLAEIMELREVYRLGSVALESNADKGYLAKELKGLGCPVTEYHEKANKFVKISSWLRSNWAGIEFLEDTDPEYLNQILDYNEYATHDDAPDSLASLIRQLANVKKWVY